MIAIVGAGPAGLAAALFLDRYQMPVHVFEGKRKGRPKVCGGFLNTNAFFLLDMIQATPVLEQVSKGEIKQLALSTGQASQSWDIPAIVYSLSRQEFDLRLWELCESRGINISEGENIRELFSEGNKVVVKTATGQSSADYAICADGMNSIAHPESLKKRNTAKRVGIQYIIKTSDLPAGVLALHFNGWGYMGTCSYQDEYFDFSAVVNMDRIPPDCRQPESILQGFIHQDKLLGESLKNYQLVCAPKVVPKAFPHHCRNQNPRIILAGDAKRFLEPFTGLGITYALASGVSAAARVLSACHPDSGIRTEMSLLGKKIEKGIKSLISTNLMIAPILRNPPIASLGANLLAGARFPVNLMLKNLMKPRFSK